MVSYEVFSFIMTIFVVVILFYKKKRHSAELDYQHTKQRGFTQHRHSIIIL